MKSHEALRLAASAARELEQVRRKLEKLQGQGMSSAKEWAAAIADLNRGDLQRLQGNSWEIELLADELAAESGA